MDNIVQFSIRCIETLLIIFGLIFSLSKLKCTLKKFIAFFSIIALFTIALILAIFLLCGVEIAEKTFIPIAIIAPIVCLSVCKEDSWYVTLSNLFTQLNVYLGVSCLTEFAAYYIKGNDYYVSYIIARAIIFTLIIFVYYRLIRKRFRRAVMIIEKEWKIVCLVALAFFIQQVFLCTYPEMHYERPTYNYLLIFMAYTVMAVVYYTMYTTLDNVMRSYEKRQQEVLTNEKMRFLEEQINLQNKTMDTVSRQSHDLRHHCVATIGLIREENYDGAISYLEQYCDKLGEGKVTYYCEHSAINCILTSMAKKAKELGINVEIDTKVPQNLSADEVELASICANSFENAIEGCTRVSQEIERRIHVVFKYKDGKLLIEVTNTCAKDIDFNGEFPITKKKFGGTGTKSIAYITEKYHGMVDFHVKDNIFTTRIVLNV